MKTENGKVTIIHYSNEWHDHLLAFMKREYPSRSENYLEFCLNTLDRSTKDVKEKAMIAVLGSDIVGCYTILPLQIINGSNRENLYVPINMIVSPRYRGNGISSSLYSFWDHYSNWVATGFTEVAWKIAPKKVRSFNSIAPIYVYLMFNRWAPVAILQKMRLIGKPKGGKSFPESGELSSLTFYRADKVSDLVFPSSGRWLLSDYEIIRDRKYMEERFFSHFRRDEYIVYSLYKNKLPIGYFVVRATEYRGVQMLSLVDFRYVKGGSMIDVLKAVSYIAKITHYGMVIVLTSLKLPLLSFSPFVLRTKKELPCATGIERLARQKNILFTSADSDLDYVYYK